MILISQMSLLLLFIFFSGHAAFRLIIGNPHFAGKDAVSDALALGVALIFLTFQLLDLLSIRFSFYLTISFLLSIIVAQTLFNRSFCKTPYRNYAATVREKNLVEILAFILFLIYLTVRVYSALNIAAGQAAFAWDAWSSWAPLSISYLNNGSFASDIVTPAASHGSFAPSMHIAGMLATNSQKEPITYFLWVVPYLATCTAIWQIIFIKTSNASCAMLGSFVFVSLPYPLIHLALPGYADLWLMFFVTMIALSFERFSASRCIEFLVLSFVYCCIAFCIKQAAAIWVISASIVLVFLCNSSRGRIFFKINFAALSIVIVFAILQLAGQTEGSYVSSLIALFSESAAKIIGESFHRFDEGWVGYALVSTLFLTSNWHLLFAAVLFTSCYRLYTNNLAFEASPTFTIGFVGVCLIYLFYSIFDASSAQNQTSLTRSLLPIAPIAVIVLSTNIWAILHHRALRI